VARDEEIFVDSACAFAMSNVKIGLSNQSPLKTVPFQPKTLPSYS